MKPQTDTNMKRVIVVWSHKNRYSEPETMVFNLQDHDLARAAFLSLSAEKKAGRIEDCGFYQRRITA